MIERHAVLLRECLSKVVPFTPTDITKALEQFSFTTYQPKEFIFSCGDLVRDVHFVIDGIGRYFYTDKEGVEKNKSLVRIGGAFASVSTLLEGSPSPFYAQAVTCCTTASISYASLVDMADACPQWSTFVRRVYERLVLKKEKREAGFLLLSARERYEEFLVEFGEDAAKVPLRQVAMYIGVTDVSLSRIRREMGLT